MAFTVCVAWCESLLLLATDDAIDIGCVRLRPLEWCMDGFIAELFTECDKLVGGGADICAMPCAGTPGWPIDNDVGTEGCCK